VRHRAGGAAAIRLRRALRTDGKEPINGWANNPRIEELRAARLDTADLQQQKRDLRRFAEAALARRAVRPDGRILADKRQPQAPTDILPDCFATFDGVHAI
jgi:hypothetical protein